MKKMTGEQEREARPRIHLKKEGKKCASAETKSGDRMTDASTRKDHTGSRANLWLSETHT